MILSLSIHLSYVFHSGNSTVGCGAARPRGEGFVYDVNEEHLNELDTAFVWLRYIHAVVVPILIFAIHKVITKLLYRSH